MSLLSLSGVGVFLGGRSIFTDASFDVSEGDKIGLVGRNGTGKTTLLRIIAGDVEADTGQILRSKGTRIGFLRQEVNGVVAIGALEKEAPENAAQGRQPEASVLSNAMDAFAALFALRREMRELEKAMARPEVYSDGERLQKVLSQYDTLSQQFERQDGYNLEVKARTVLFGLGFREDQLQQAPSTLSGGQKVRLGLARLLLEEPDLLLLDEPTNHLDLEAAQWLEDFLGSYKQAFILVSHDRYFLDAVTRRTLEIEDGKLTICSGNYSAYVAQKQADRERQEKLYRRQQEEIQRVQFFVDKFRAGTRSTMAKSREKYLARMERVERPRGDGPHANFSLRSSHSSSRVAVSLADVAKSYGEKSVLAGVDLELERGMRLGVVGPNGSGKTTLARLMTGREEPTRGAVRRGDDVRIGYFTQELADLTPGNTVLEELLTVRNVPIGEGRSLLARFLFRGDDVFKPVDVLSGGERNRLHLARLLLAAPSLLVLDEPTNHLDIAAREALEDALRSFEGTLVIISHDRYLLDRTATVIAEVDGGRVRVFEGNYSAYWAAREAERTKPAGTENGATRVVSAGGPIPVRSVGQGKSDGARMPRARDSGAQQRGAPDAGRIEEEIAGLEDELTRLNELLSDPGLYASADSVRVRDVVARQRELLRKIEERYQTWEESASRE